MKVILTAGGTGGHIYPALGVIEELKKDKNNEPNPANTNASTSIVGNIGASNTAAPHHKYDILNILFTNSLFKCSL